MPSDFSRRPKLQKGALVVYESQVSDVCAQVIAFQYNPDQLSRTLTRRAPSGESGSSGGARQDVFRVEGPPKEEIKMTVVLDAADQLAEPDATTSKAVIEGGLYPALATLELLLYPSTEQVQQSAEQVKSGFVQISSGNLPMTLLCWGASRVAPVLLTSFSVTEEAFDQELRPIRAKVNLGMLVLTNMELKEKTQGHKVFSAYHTKKEKLAQLYATPGDRDKEIRQLLPGSDGKKGG
ncbi:hypothetical protein ACFLTM_02100 [Candidatus Bipolaricaulota bacterium]